MRSLLCLGLILAAPGGMDVMVPGHKRVEHRLVLDWNREALPFQFVATPTHGFAGVHPIRPGEPFRFSSKYGTKILALPSSMALPTDGRKLDADPSWPKCSIPIAEISSMPATHPVAVIETSLRITKVTDSSIEFESLGERRLDADGRELGGSHVWPLLLIAIGGIAGLAYLGTARRNEIAPKPSA